MEYFALYPQKESGVQKIQKADLFYNSKLKADESDDYSWNTTLAKHVNFPNEFWLVFNTANLVFDYARYSTLFLISSRFFDVIYKYCSKDIQYVKVNMVNKKTKEIANSMYYFVKFTTDQDWIDKEKSKCEQKYDFITQKNEIIRYTNIILKEKIDNQKEIFILRDKILGWIIYINNEIKQEIEKKELDKHLHIIPVDKVAAFHNDYYFL